MRAALLDVNGEVTRMDAELLPASYSQAGASAVWTGSSYQLAWKQHLNTTTISGHSPPIRYEHRTMRLSSDGTIVPNSLRVVSAEMADASHTDLGMATNGEETIVVGTDRVEILSIDGDVLSTRELDSPLPDPDAAWNGSEFLIWSRGGRGVARVRSSGAGSELVQSIFNEEGSPQIADIAPLAGRATLVAYTTAWLPLPEAHARSIDRAYYQILSPVRRKLVRRR